MTRSKEDVHMFARDMIQVDIRTHPKTVWPFLFQIVCLRV